MSVIFQFAMYFYIIFENVTSCMGNLNKIKLFGRDLIEANMMTAWYNNSQCL